MREIILFGILLAGLTSGAKDTVVLTTGESVEGHMISADENTVRVRDSRGIIKEIPRKKVSSIRLHTTSSAAAKQPLAPTAEPEKAASTAPGVPEEQKFCDLVTSFQKATRVCAREQSNP